MHALATINPFYAARLNAWQLHPATAATGDRSTPGCRWHRSPPARCRT